MPIPVVLIMSLILESKHMEMADHIGTYNIMMNIETVKDICYLSSEIV